MLDMIEIYPKIRDCLAVIVSKSSLCARTVALHNFVIALFETLPALVPCSGSLASCDQG